jgi:membrane protein
MTVLVLAATTVPFAMASLGLIAVLPAVMDVLPLSPSAKIAISVIRWPILVVLFMTVLATVYRCAPHRVAQGWQWANPGAVGAIVLWITVSAVFSVYMSEFLPYDRSYGELGSLMALLAWLNVTAFGLKSMPRVVARIRQRQLFE